MKMLPTNLWFGFFAALMVAVSLLVALHSADQSDYNTVIGALVLLIFSRQNFSVSALIRQAKLYARNAKEDTLAIASLLGDEDVEEKYRRQIAALDEDISLENVEYFWAFASSLLVSVVALLLIAYSLIR